MKNTITIFLTCRTLMLRSWICCQFPMINYGNVASLVCLLHPWHFLYSLIVNNGRSLIKEFWCCRLCYRFWWPPKPDLVLFWQFSEAAVLALLIEDVMKKDEAIKRVNEGELISLIYYFCHLQHMFKSTTSWAYGVLLRKWFKYSNVVSKEIAILPNYNWSVTTHDECQYSYSNLDSPFQQS